MNRIKVHCDEHYDRLRGRWITEYWWELCDNDGRHITDSTKETTNTYDPYYDESYEASSWNDEDKARRIGEEWAVNNGYPLDDEQ